MIWQNWHDFFAMGGYALHVWGSVAVVFVGMAAEVVALNYRYKSIRAQLNNVRATRK